MPKEHIGKVLGEVAKLTTVLINAVKIKDNLDVIKNKNDAVKALEDTKALVKEIHEKSSKIKEKFDEQYAEILEVIEQTDKSKAINGNDSSSVSDGAQCEGVGNKANGTVMPKIKLVDINKLVEPKSNQDSLKKPLPMRNSKRKSVQFNQSVVVISSSEDESTEKSSEKKAEEPALAKKDSEEKTETPCDDTIEKPTKVGKKRKRNLIEHVKLSSTSESDDSDKDVVLKNKTYNKPVTTVQKKRKIHDVDWEKDVKFKSKCYIDLLRIPCEKMKEYYTEKFEMLEVLKLTRTDNLEKIRSDKRESDNRRTRLQRSKLSLKHTPKKPVDSGSSDEDSDGTEPEETKEAAPDTPDNTLEENSLAEAVLCELSSDNDETKLDTHSSEDESDNNKKKKKSTTEKTQGDSTKDSSKAEDGDHVKESEDAANKKDCDGNKSALDKETTSIDEAKKSEDDETGKDKKQTNDEKNCDEDTDKASDGSNDSVERASSKNKKKGKDKKSKKSKETEKSKDKDTDNSSDSESSENEESKKKKDKKNSKWKKDELLTVCLSSSDSEKDREKMKRKKKKMDDKKSDEGDDDVTAKPKSKKKLVKKKVKKAFVLDSDSDGSKSSKSKSDEEDSKKESSSSSESEEEKKESKKRKRVKHVKDSSEDDDDKDTRKQIRRVIGRDSLAETTKKAEEEEKERKARLAEKQKKYNNLLSLGHEKTNATVDKVVLDFDEKTEEELLRVDDELVKKLKPHQANGVRFMWEACFESLERAGKAPGSGCILAHCMGLGKTLQVIALAHTLLTNFEQTKVKKIMVVCPLNTVLNWVNEFKQWLPDNDDYEIYELVSFKQNYERQYQVKTWHNNGGVLIIGYDMFRNLSNPENKKVSKKMRTAFYEALVDPGPDLVICDEGHLLKNEKTNISIAMNRLKTLRRIVLTGTPLQNNLKEYFCMVQFIKPNLLGTYKEYLNRFVNPITNGQYTDSTPHDIQIMRKRSHVLHKMLDGIVQRRDYSVLQPYLPPKHEYVLFLTLSEMQIKLYGHYLRHMAKKSSLTNTSFLFVDFQAFQRICTHPRVLLDKSNEEKAKEKTDDEDSEGSLRDFIDDDDGGTTSSTSSSKSSGSDDEKSDTEKSKKKSSKARGGRITRAVAATAKENGIVLEEEDDVIAIENKEWWQEYCDGSELDVIAHGSKLFLLFEILKECEQIGDKVLVFSQSLYSLNVIEYFLDKIDCATERGDPESVGGYTGNWHLGLDYFRLDGSSSCDNRNIWCKSFNNPKNTRARLFLISTRAGGLGINLVAANRVIIFDVSWNPSHDIQSIYRVYRFGQTKPCYIYRFVTYGTMEMKIYERQVTKQAISKRVIDEQQIDRHYNQNDLAELYKFDPKPDDRPIPLVPKDVLLGEMLQKFEDRIFKYHEHQSLLENKEDETLNEEERKAAWEEFESEKVQRQNRIPNLLSSQALASAMISLVRKDNPDWNDNQIRSVIPALSLKLQAQLSVGDFSMYKQIQTEVQLLNQMQQQKLRMQQLQNQYRFMNNMQQQEHEARMDLSINPASLYPALYSQVELGQPGTSRANPDDSIIELHD